MPIVIGVLVAVGPAVAATARRRWARPAGGCSRSCRRPRGSRRLLQMGVRLRPRPGHGERDHQGPGHELSAPAHRVEAALELHRHLAARVRRLPHRYVRSALGVVSSLTDRRPPERPLRPSGAAARSHLSMRPRGVLRCWRFAVALSGAAPAPRPWWRAATPATSAGWPSPTRASAARSCRRRTGPHLRLHRVPGGVRRRDGRRPRARGRSSLPTSTPARLVPVDSAVFLRSDALHSPMGRGLGGDRAPGRGAPWGESPYVAARSLP